MNGQLRMSRERDIAHEPARIGGETLMRSLRGGTVARSKLAAELVTDADVESERAIVEHIRRTCRDHAGLGEEAHAADISAEHLWIVDPLDGTTNFAHRIPHFA